MRDYKHYDFLHQPIYMMSIPMSHMLVGNRMFILHRVTWIIFTSTEMN